MVKCKYCGKETNRKKFCNRECLKKWRVGKTNVEMWGEEKAKQCREKQLKKATGKPSKLKGRTYEDIHGEEKAKKLRRDKFKNSDRHARKGKTYEEIYGEEEAKRLRKLRSIGAHNKPRWGKAGVIVCGVCGIEMNARGYGQHWKWHELGRDKKHKCANESCSVMIPYGKKSCSYSCSAIVRCKEIGSERMRETKRRSLMENPESSPNRLCAGMGRSKKTVSSPQRKLFDMVVEIFGEAELNHPVNTGRTVRYLDVAVISKKMDFEYDGEYFHRNRKEKDEERNLELFSAGWKVVHISEKDDMRKVVSSFQKEGAL